MALCWKFMIVLSVLQVIQAATIGSTTSLLTSPLPSQDISRRLQGHKSYLSSYNDKKAQTVTYTTQPLQEPDTFLTQPQVNAKKENIKPHKFILNSYAPPASGLASTYQYSAPQPSQIIQLPALPPLSLTRDALKPRMLMVEEPASVFLTPNQNKTLEAARLLANSLLEANGEQPLPPQDYAPVVLNSGNVPQNPNTLNRTNVLIVKAQKHAYIIPKELGSEQAESVSSTGRNRVQELYQMRDQFPKAYTVNQFIFIIKPEKINFLNKLV